MEIEKDGQKQEVALVNKPILDGRFFELRWMARDHKGKVVIEGLDIIGRDPKDNKLKFWEVDTEGNFTQLILSEREGPKSVWDLREWGADGATRSGKVTKKVLDRNAYDWVIQYDDGEENQATFKRTRKQADLWPEPQADMPETVSPQLQDVAWWAGDYTVEGRDAFTGKTAVGQSTCGWILDGRALLCDEASIANDLAANSYRAVLGVDPTTKKTTGWEFSSDGTVGKYTVSDKGQDIQGKAFSPESGLLEYKGKMTQTENGVEYQATGALPEGKEVEYHTVWTKRE